jgi:hypothetical protein
MRFDTGKNLQARKTVLEELSEVDTHPDLAVGWAFSAC